ncbi:8922_t:CDS:2 [Entrophospora sp. SA101]|nr:5141_t:CDS:2 [Entrophospora sp. SA101]CAJ0639483.1 8922_t:CDS:2 [Entrophospora sp. SA101]CAJ0828411.1 13890_t:CDS:2 [Entrophospora sp. SA101]
MSDFRYGRTQSYRPDYNNNNRTSRGDREYREGNRHHRRRRSRSRGRLDEFNIRSWERHHPYDSPHEDNNSKRRKTRHERDRVPEGRWRERNLGEPNNHVILQGLPLSASEDDIQNTLESLHASIENIRLIRDRRTGDSRRFAFVKFTSVEHARQFIEANHPFIMMDDIRVRVEYSNSASAEDEESMESAALQSTPTSSFFNDGENDLGHVPYHVLLVRGLDPLTTEETLYAATSQLAALRRVMLIKDRASRISWGFAFLDYQDVQASSYILSLVNNPQYYPDGFIIDSRPVDITFANPSSFIPAYATTEWTIWGDDGIAMSYWDQKAYAVEYSSGNGDGGGTVEDELDAFYSDMGAALTSSGKSESKSIFSVSDMVVTTT